MISLVMLSGGIDSAYARHKLLRETDDEVIAHHIHLITDHGRHIPEAEACKKIVSFCSTKVRPMMYTESSIDHRRFVVQGFDLIAAGFEAGMVASSFRVVHGSKKSIDRWIAGISADDTITERRLNHARLTARYNTVVGASPKLFLFPRLDVRDQIRSMPMELFEATWSCRFPKNLPYHPAPCGTCSSCTRRITAARDVYANVN